MAMEMNIEGAVRLVLSAIIAFLQLLCQDGGGVEREACFNSHTVSFYVSISLLSLTASMPLPTSIFPKISISSVVLACAYILSCSVPQKLMWVPYFSCIRPFFHLLPNPLRDRFLQLSQNLWNKADQHMRDSIKWLFSYFSTPDASTPQSPPLPRGQV